MSVQTLSAAQAVAEMLQSPEDLGKIATFRKKLEKEKASIDVKLKSGVKDQLDATREALRRLHNTRDNVQAIKDEMVNIEKMCGDPQYTVPMFKSISSVSAVHRNFVQTEEMINNFRGMHQKLDVLQDLLEREKDDIPGPAPNILRIHFQLNELEDFRNQTMYQAKRASEESRNTMERWFEPLNALVGKFEEYLWTLARNILPLVRANYHTTVVKLVKICEAEGKQDENAIATKFAKKAAKSDLAAKFKSITANARTLKHYRATLVKTIRDNIQAAFDTSYAANVNDPIAFLDGLSWMYQDIIRLQDDVIQCFPPDYDVYGLYIKQYHKSLDGRVKAIVAEDPDASTILALHAWLKEYKNNMLKELEVPPEFLEPPLLDGKEQTLIQDYLKLIVSKMDEWSNNLMKTESKEFTTRSNPLEVDQDGLFSTQGAIILFQMINQQTEAAKDSGQGSILAHVATESARVMRNTQDQWTKLIDSEFKKQIEKPDEAPPALFEYIIALANDQIKCAESANDLATRVEEVVNVKFKKDIEEKLNEAIDGYLDVATKKCTGTLIDLSLNDLKPVIKQLFTPPWYEGIMAQITATLRDYMDDCKEHLHPSIMDALVDQLLDTFIIMYLTALGNASKLRMPATIDRIKADVGEAYQFFATLKSGKEVEQHFDVVDQVLNLLEASSSMAFLSFWDFAKVHGPNVAFVESIMKARDDLDRTAVNEVMESVKRKVKEENLTEPEEGTIMKKVRLQGTFQRLLVSARTIYE